MQAVTMIPIVRSALGTAQRAIPHQNLHVRDPQLRQHPPGGRGQGGKAFDGDDFSRQPGKDRRLISAAGPDLQHVFDAREIQLLRHQRDDVGLADGLPVADGESRVFVRGVLQRLRDELLAWRLFDRVEDALSLIPRSSSSSRNCRGMGNRSSRRYDPVSRSIRSPVEEMQFHVFRSAEAIDGRGKADRERPANPAERLGPLGTAEGDGPHRCVVLAHCQREVTIAVPHCSRRFSQFDARRREHGSPILVAERTQRIEFLDRPRRHIAEPDLRVDLEFGLAGSRSVVLGDVSAKLFAKSVDPLGRDRNPAAALCPPNETKWAAQADRPECRSNPP